MDTDTQKFLAFPALKQFSLEGNAAIVTGAGSGLGMVVAKGFAQAGAMVALVDKNFEAIEKLSGDICSAGYSAIPIEADITIEDEVKMTVQTAVKEFGCLDTVVNCAGITRRMPLEKFNEADWELVLNVNLKGTFLFTKHAAEQMLIKGRGSIINFGSLGSLVAIPQSAAYCASKGGVAMLTKTAACEWAKRGVRVNAIIPGTFKTPLLEQCIREKPEYGEEMLQRFPIGRFAEPEEIVGACIFLASDASTYVTGHLLAVDGGCTAY